jgi:hypothetical protein
MQKYVRSMRRKFDINSVTVLNHFREVAARASRRSLKSKNAARKVLVSEGIVTPTGRLTKNYRDR